MRLATGLLNYNLLGMRDQPCLPFRDWTFRIRFKCRWLRLGHVGRFSDIIGRKSIDQGLLRDVKKLTCNGVCQSQARFALIVGEDNARPHFTQRQFSYLHVYWPGTQLRSMSCSTKVLADDPASSEANTLPD